MILLWGISGDGPLAAVRQAIEQQRSPFLFLDQQAVLDTRLELSVGHEIKGTLQLRSQVVELEEITATYLRPYDSRRMRTVEQAGPESAAFYHALSLEDALYCWSELTPTLVVNRPSAMAPNNSKPYQTSLIHSLGMNVPDTLITTDRQAAIAFWEKHGSVIYKSVSGVRSIVSQLKPEHHSRLKDIANCPTQFQQYIEGTDYRVHVVGEEIFACEIISLSDDYRYSGMQETEIKIRPCELPQDLGCQCITLAKAMHLSVAGIDLRRNTTGEWYCFEVNPSPGFTFYQEATGQPISEAIARLLARQPA